MSRWILALICLAAAGRIAWARDLRIYTEIYEPLQIQKPDGTLSGIAIDVVREIQRRVGSSEPIQVVPWARSYEEVQTQPDVVLFAMSRTADRDPLFQWVGPLDETVVCFWLKKDSAAELKSLDDAKKLKAIGVYRNDVRDLFLTRAGFANLDRVTDNVLNMKKLLAGRIDALAANAVEIVDLAKAGGGSVSALKPSLPFLRTQQFIAFSKGTAAATVKAWAEALEAMKKDKTFDRIYRDYEPTKPLPGAVKAPL